MTANQTNARSNIVARLQTMPGVTVYRGIPDNDQLARDAFGAILPYGVVKFAGPIPTSQGRGLALDESQQPVIMTLMFVGYAGTQEGAESVAIAGTDLLLGFSPDGINATPLHAAGGYSFTTRSTQNQPTRYEEAVSFQTTLNMSVVGI